MNVLRFTVLLALCGALPALAQAECDDAFLECKDDCVIEFGGSVRVEMKKRYDKCMKKCVKTVNRCTERVLETKNNQLDEGALEGTTGSDEVDKDGLPNRTAGKKKKAVATEPAADDAAADEEPARKKEALREEEVPRSNRTSLKTDPRDEPAPAKRDEPPPAKKEEPAAKAKSEPVIEMKLAPRKEEDDLRDDRPRPAEPAKKAAVEDEPPPPPKRREKKEEPPKKKEEDHDDLRFY